MIKSLFIFIAAIFALGSAAIMLYAMIKECIIKRKILEIAMRSGYDFDGDIITYNKKRYYVDISRKFVMEV